jgi:penicillin-binding protein 1A
MASSAKSRRRNSGGEPPHRGSALLRLLRGLAVWTFAVFLLFALGLTAAVLVTARSLPSYERLKSSQTGHMIVVRAADGSEIVTLGPSYGKWIPIGRIPRVMQDAMVSVEDRRFRDHWGVDPIGIARSVLVRVQSGHWRQGGSTITQQLARNTFLNSSRTFDRKIREIVLALALETQFSKDQILELYLNKVYFGGGAYGVDSAARKFFGHSGEQLSLAEASIIAGLVKAPSHYSPTADAKAAVDRAQIVIKTMQEAGTITPAQAEAVDLKHKRNPHILRHSRATHLLMEGVSLWDVAKLLGDTVATDRGAMCQRCQRSTHSETCSVVAKWGSPVHAIASASHSCPAFG